MIVSNYHISLSQNDYIMKKKTFVVEELKQKNKKW